jgi:hypothetical protein
MKQRKLGKKQVEALMRFGRDPESDWEYARTHRNRMVMHDWGSWHTLSVRPWPILRSLNKRGVLDLRVEPEPYGNNDPLKTRLRWQARANDNGRKIIEEYRSSGGEM